MSAGRQSKQAQAGVIASVLMSSSRSSTRRSSIDRSSSPRELAADELGVLGQEQDPLARARARWCLDGFMSDSRRYYIAMVTPPRPVGRARFRRHRDAEGHRRRDLRSLRAARAGARSTPPGCGTKSRCPRRSGGCGRWRARSGSRRWPTRARSAICGPGSTRCSAAARRGRRALWLASGGFDFYIEALLGRAARARSSAATSTRPASSKGGIEVDFPHAELACGRCAVCKGKVCDAARATGRPTVFVGDGASDRCAIGRADRIFAVRGSLLARACDERGIAALRLRRLRRGRRYIVVAHMM